MGFWFLRKAGSRSGALFHHDISYFDFEASIWVRWLRMVSVTKLEGIAWVKGSHLKNGKTRI
jgi:hypothetical protein